MNDWNTDMFVWMTRRLFWRKLTFIYVFANTASVSIFSAHFVFIIHSVYLLIGLPVNHICWSTIVLLCLSRYFIVNLVLWLPRAFPDNWFINSLCAHFVFKRSRIYTKFFLMIHPRPFVGTSCQGVGNSKTRKILS